MITKKILNCTVHNLTESQIKDGGFEPSQELKNQIKEILTIVSIPDEDELEERAEKFAQIIDEYRDQELDNGIDIMPSILIGSGTPSIQPYIVKALTSRGVDYVYSHSERECVETHNPDGTVQKVFIFAHKGWY